MLKLYYDFSRILQVLVNSLSGIIDNIDYVKRIGKRSREQYVCNVVWNNGRVLCVMFEVDGFVEFTCIGTMYMYVRYTGKRATKLKLRDKRTLLASLVSYADTILYWGLHLSQPPYSFLLQHSDKWI